MNREEEIKTTDYWANKFKEAMIHKSSITAEWSDYWEAYTGDYFAQTNGPSYKSNHVSNFIFSTIETMRPIIVDGDPGFLALARNEDGIIVQDKIQKALDYEFDREKMGIKIPRQTITTLVLGTSVWFLPWDGEAKSDYEGEIRAIEVDPFNLFPDPLATSVSDAEYLIYATYKHINKVKQEFPNKANLLDGGNIKYEELVANRQAPSKADNQVLILEVWCKDYATTEEEEEDKEDGKTYKVTKAKYPNGRVLVIAPELNVLLSDKENPYKDGKFPFVLVKDYDIPFQFWGDGEVKQLLSPQKAINDLSNQIIDNAKLTANTPWIVDKNAGIGYGTLTNEPGMVIRRNPGTKIERPAPPPMPTYISNQIDELKQDMETISGVHDVTQGRRPTGIQAGNAIMALQEAGQARIRMKVKILEDSLSELATMWYSRMQQFWKLDRWIRLSDEASDDREYDMISSDELAGDFDVKIAGGSTMQKNRAGMLDLGIRLAQTTAEDGLPMIDREALLEFVDLKNKPAIKRRMAEMAEQQNINEQTAETVGAMSEEMSGQREDISGILEDIMNMITELSNDIQELQAESASAKEEEQDIPEEIPGQMSMVPNQAEGGLTAEDIVMMVLNGEVQTEEEIIMLAQENGVMPEEIMQILAEMQGGGAQSPEEEEMELLTMIDNLTEEELAQLLQEVPNLAELLGE